MNIIKIRHGIFLYFFLFIIRTKITNNPNTNVNFTRIGCIGDI